MEWNKLNFEEWNFIPRIIVIDRSGTVIWTNKKKRTPIIKIGTDILSLIPDLDLAQVFASTSWQFFTYNNQSYVVNSHLMEKDQGAVLCFTPVETKSVSMLVENFFEGFIFIDKYGIIRIINETLARYLKFPKKQLIGRHFDTFGIDPALHRTLETQKPDLLSVFYPRRNLLASRHPVFLNDEFIGAYGRYFSIDSRDLNENYIGEGYPNVLEDLEVGNIIQAMVELKAYKSEFYKTNTTKLGVENIIGSSPVMMELKKKILAIWDSPSSVLLTGSSGTGKELFAQAIHYHSERNNFPFIKVNCAAIPENLLEAELFGYVEGAFTGARKGGRVGKFEMANKGIIFLDEIGDMPLAMQAKLLRVIQEREIERLGSEITIPIDVRVISATNKDLYDMTLKGQFRADLYYRLNVINLNIPDLQDRKSDIPDLVYYFIETLNSKLKRNITGVSSEVMDRFMSYEWPGNIREMINVLEAAMNFCRSDTVGLDHLPFSFVAEYVKYPSKDEDLHSTIDDIKKTEVVSALEKCGGQRKAAASLLGVSKSTLYRLMKKYDMI